MLQKIIYLCKKERRGSHTGKKKKHSGNGIRIIVVIENFDDETHNKMNNFFIFFSIPY